MTSSWPLDRSPSLNATDTHQEGRKESWRFTDGTVVTIEVPGGQPSISVKHAVYCLSAVLHHTHQAMRP